ncbi:MAG: Fe-S cluster assembly ATPase SufC [Planctomycetota bacterium]|jgi:Fe-S cluster assembly ATP-binding protein|nr:Fe-S cluster assembly ATPase SufC [Planctomycetota bacterium]
MLEIKDLSISVENTPIIKNLSLTVRRGEIHAIMGPNGAGKSTLARSIMGYPGYEVNQGSVLLDDKDMTELEPEERATSGLFVSFQYPVEIPGVNNAEFLRMALNAKRNSQGLEELDPLDFDDLLTQKMDALHIDRDFKNRGLNEGFSGGEKKRNEILQMAVLDPKFAILDETDSGLDIDALRIVSSGVNQLANEQNGLILITHYQRLLNHIQPDHVHVLLDGEIVKTGGKELALELEEKGYDWLKQPSHS